MIVKLEENLSQKDIEVLIKFATMNRTVRRLETLVKSVDKTIKCNSENAELWLNSACFRSLINSQMEATLTNGERINVTRKYVSAIREKLQEG